MESDKTNIIVIDMCPKFSGMFIIRLVSFASPLSYTLHSTQCVSSIVHAFVLHKHIASPADLFHSNTPLTAQQRANSYKTA